MADDLRRIFDRRAARFDEASFLAREIAQRMDQRLDYIKLAPVRILDAGCGPGNDLAELRTRFKQAIICGLDLSARMAARAAASVNGEAGGRRNHWRRWLPAQLRQAFSAGRPTVVQANFAALPFAAGAFDLLWSNLALHWHKAPATVFPEWLRALKVGGLLMFSTLGPDSLQELRSAWREADGIAPCSSSDSERRAIAHLIDFVDMHDLGDMLIESGFEAPVIDTERLTVTYRTAGALLADMRRWGAYPFTAPGCPGGLTARRARAALFDALNRQRRSDGTLALSFEVIYGHAWKPAPKTTPEGHAIVRLESIGKRANID